ncbi:LysR family transcriptional regulator [Thalassomonas actiniarum]|uniref:LysR family transcriptional regulator n=1 Tax=Thalassomonas actiniarum TaxID=485447 RepID=A0AAF0C312_9GAMM|nr:LysR family transcriptional regulator [Thalassomonas actiniarum]WDD98483.1 LysR family transcriptional regulator [Thalassomonas actiniarum]
MDLRSLQYFVAVFEKRSFSAAAKTCYVAQPSISAAVAQLEQHLNTSLFNRHARGVNPTNSGDKLYPLAKQLIGQADAIKTVFTERSVKQPFYLGVTKGLGVKRMSALLKDFTSAEQQVELTLVPHTEPCDARIIIKEELKEQETHWSLWQEDYLLALPYNHILSLQDSIKLRDLDGLPFIQRTPCTEWDTLSDALTLEGISVDTRAKIQTIDYALGLVQAGLGCALVPAHPEIISKTDVVFKPIEGLRLMRETILAYQQPSDIINTLLQLVLKHRR